VGIINVGEDSHMRGFTLLKLINCIRGNNQKEADKIILKKEKDFNQRNMRVH